MVAVKLAFEAPPRTVTLAGSVTAALLLTKATLNPAEGAELPSVTIQAADPGAFTVAGLHDRPLTEGRIVWLIEIVAPEPEPEMALPVLVDAITPLI